jgi:hypothetical protein
LLVEIPNGRYSCAQRRWFGFIVARQLGDPYAVALVVALVMLSAMKMRLGEICWTHIKGPKLREAIQSERDADQYATALFAKIANECESKYPSMGIREMPD